MNRTLYHRNGVITQSSFLISNKHPISGHPTNSKREYRMSELLVIANEVYQFITFYRPLRTFIHPSLRVLPYFTADLDFFRLHTYLHRLITD